eukprot:243025-Karenia_brevis.AAC.1
MAWLARDSQGLDVLDTLLGQLVGKHEQYKEGWKQYSDFLLYSKKAHKINENAKARVYFFIIAAKNKTSRHRTNFISSRTILEVKLHSFKYADLKAFYD